MKAVSIHLPFMRSNAARHVPGCIHALSQKGEREAAEAWRDILDDPEVEAAIVSIAAFYEAETARRRFTRTAKPSDIARLAEETRQIEARVNEIRREAIRLYEGFAAVPGFPSRGEVGRPCLVAIYAVDDVVNALDSMMRAIRDAYGPNPSGRTPLSHKLDGDPLEGFGLSLSYIWCDAGLTLHRKDRAMFEAILRALNEAMTGQEDLPEKLVARIIARRKSD